MSNRRFGLYFSWNRAKENAALLGTLENRFPTLFEFRRAIWPRYEHASDPLQFKQDVTGFLDHVVLFDFQQFRKIIGEVTGTLPAIFQRNGTNGEVQTLDEQLLQSLDTLIIVSLDHLTSGQQMDADEHAAVNRFLERDGTCLIVCPHHDVGATDNFEERIVEHTHHGDVLVPSQQRFSGFARSVLASLGLPVINRYGLSPGRAADGSPALLRIEREADELGVLVGVTTFNLHPHLPHLEVSAASSDKIRVLARQPLNRASPHPFIKDRIDSFNALLWAPPEAGRGGHMFVCDATLWSSAFGGTESLIKFWRNLANLP